MDVGAETLADLVGFLERGRWKKADKETGRVIAASVGSDGEDGLSDGELASVDAGLIRELDELWMEHSHGRFGFSPQVAAWERAEGDVKLFATFVGWRRRNAYVTYGALNFDLSAPDGHLPVGGPGGIYWPSEDDSGAFRMMGESTKSVFWDLRQQGGIRRFAALVARAKLSGAKELPENSYSAAWWAPGRPAVLAKLVDRGSDDEE
jgi:hypothetical protein